MLGKIRDRQINTELIATFLFIVISAIYILNKYGFEKLLDNLFLWMFPASIMIFLTLVIVKLIERAARIRHHREHKYINIEDVKGDWD